MAPSRDDEIYSLQIKLDDTPTDKRQALLDSWDEVTRREVLRRVEATEKLDPDAVRQVKVSMSDADAPNLAGREIDGRYRLERRLDHGGMGDVYVAEDLKPRDERSSQVAVKLLPSASPSLASRFKRERQILFELQHDGIVRAFDAGTFEGRPYIVMEWIHGGLHLDDYCKKKALDADGCVRLVAEICDAVSFAHGKNVIHRDLKPANILVTPAGHPKLLDFGVAKILMSAESETQHDEVVGTPDYLSPEQRTAAQVTPQADQYALGVILYLLLARTLPREKGSQAISRGSGARIRHRRIVRLRKQATKDAPILTMTWRRRRDLEAITLKALRHDAADRFVSIDELRENLERWLRKEPLEFTRRSWIHRLGRSVRRYPRLSVLVTAIVGAGAAGGVGYYYQHGGAAQLAALITGHLTELNRKDAEITQLENRVRVLTYEQARRFLAEGSPGAAHDAIGQLSPTTVEEQLIRAMVNRLAVALGTRGDEGTRVVFERDGDAVFEMSKGQVRKRGQAAPVFNGTLLPALDGVPFAVGFDRGTYFAVDGEGRLCLLATSTMTSDLLVALKGAARGGSVAPDGNHVGLIDDTGLLIVAKGDHQVVYQAGVREARWVAPDRLLMIKEQGVELLALQTNTVTPLPSLAGATAFVVSRDGRIAALFPHQVLLVDWQRVDTPVAVLDGRVRAAAFSQSGRKLAVVRENNQIATFLVEASYEDGNSLRGLRPLAAASLQGTSPGKEMALRFTRDDSLLVVAGAHPVLLGASSLRTVATLAGPQQAEGATVIVDTPPVFAAGAATFSATGDLLVVTAKGLDLRTPEGGRTRRSLDGPPGESYRRIVAAPDFTDVLLLADTTLSRWTSGTLEKRWAFVLTESSAPAPAAAAPIVGPVWSPDGRLIAIAVGGTLHVLNGATGAVQASSDVLAAAAIEFITDAAGALLVRLTTAAPKGPTVTTFAQQRDYQPRDLALVRESRATETRVVARAATTCLVAEARGDGSIVVVDAKGQRALVHLEGLDGLPEFIQLHPQHRAVLAHRAGRTRVWDLGVSDASAPCAHE